MNLLGITRSSNEEVSEGYGPAIQQAELIAYCHQNFHELIYTEQVIERATINLEERLLFKGAIDKAINLQQSGQCNGVIFSRCDRLSRQMDSAIQVALDLRKAGLTIVLVRENQVLRPDDPPINLVMFILQAFGVDTQTRITLKNTKEGQRKAAEAGRLPSGVGSRGLYGYNLVGAQKQKKFEVNSNVWIVDEVLRLGLEGGSINSITRGLMSKGVKITRDTVRKILKHARVYAGLYKWGELEISGLIPPRITIEEAKIIETNMARNRESSYGWGKRTWLTGRVYCGKCGGKYVLEKSKKRCHCRRNNRLEYINNCESPKISYPKLQSAIWELFFANICEPDVIKPLLIEASDNWRVQQATLDQQIADTNTQLKRIEEKRNRLLWQHRENFISDDELRRDIKSLQPKVDFLNSKLSQLKAVNQPAPPNPDKIKQWGDWMYEFRNANYVADDERKNKIADEFNLQITISPAEDAQLRLQISANIDLPVNQIELNTGGDFRAMVCSSPWKWRGREARMSFQRSWNCCY